MPPSSSFPFHQFDVGDDKAEGGGQGHSPKVEGDWFPGKPMEPPGREPTADQEHLLQIVT